MISRWQQWSVRSGVLQLSLGISLVISILCASIILLVYYYKLETQNNSIADRLLDNSQSGIQYMLSAKSSLPYFDKLQLDLFGDEIDSAELFRLPWGLYEIVVSRSWRGNFPSVVKSAMVTASPNEMGKSALYIPDDNAPVYVVGTTRIAGTAYLSQRKLSTGFIDGKDYKGKKMIYGEVRQSDQLLPKFDTTILDEIKQIMKESDLPSEKFTIFDKLPFNTKSSFGSGKINYYYSDQSIDLEDSLNGNFIIHSGFKVRILASASLHDIIVIAPVIDIDNNFQGSIQCFASKMITVGVESKLHYPSSLVLMGEEQDSTIVIRHDAVVEGQVVIPGYGQNLSSSGVFTLEKKAILHGMAYINAPANIQGEVWGHLTARSVQAKTGNAVYSNHLLDAIIDGTKRSPYMPGSLGWFHTENWVIAKWLE